MNIKKQKAIIGMSGGIDSAVSAALLKRAGFEVVGVFMKFWAEPVAEGFKYAENRCCNIGAEARARRIASKLGIMFEVVNVEKEFKQSVVDYFLKEYESGRTPNPCAVCNKEIKFKIMLEKALELKADFIATGHYAKIKKVKNTYSILKSYDNEKDQTYFLWQLSQNQLKHILFPVGGYTKNEVRELAKEFKLPEVNSIKESQEVCFVLSSLEKFLKKYIKVKPGKIIQQRFRHNPSQPLLLL